MKRFSKSALTILGAAALVGSAQAASITWGNAITITNDADISTNGNFEYGGYFVPTTATVTINGVTFAASGGSHSFGANFSASFASGGTAYSGMGAGTNVVALSTNYQTLLGGCVYGGSNLNSITLNNLKIGYQYTVQLWINDSRSNGANSSNTVTSGNSVNLDYNNKNAVGGVGQYAFGTFIADYPTLTFYLQSHQSGQFNALQLRSLPATAATLAPITNVTIGVNAAQSLRTVDRRLFALNTAIYDGSLQGESSIPLLFEMNNQALRWPGGGYGDTWLLSTEAQRPSWEPRLTNFLYIIKSTGASASMIANYGSGQPSDAASLVACCNLTNKVYCKYWEIGNETFGTWEHDETVPWFTANDIVDLPDLANMLYTPTNNISAYLRTNVLSSGTLTALTNYIVNGSSYAATLSSDIVSDLNNNFINFVSASYNPYSLYLKNTNLFAGVTFRAVTWTNLSLPLPNVGQVLNNRMVLEDAYAGEINPITPPINLASNWPNVYLPHDPWTYAQRFAQYYTQMKAVDPTIKIGALAVANETSYGNGYTNHFAYNPRTGVTNYGWTPVMLATLKNLGVMPDCLIYHNYAVSGDAALLQWSTILTNDSAALRQMLVDYYSPAASNVDLCITEMGPDINDQSSTSLVGGLFYADNSGQSLLSGFNERLWWSFRNGAGAVAVNTNIYGWRNTADYGMVAGSGSQISNRYPDFYCFKLTQYFARGGESVLPVTNSSLLLATYAVKQTNGSVRLLVINKSATVNVIGNFTLPGYTADLNATAYSYGIPQDEMVRTNGTGLTDLAVTNFTTMSPSAFSYNFAPYSATVISLSPPPLPVTKQYQTRITFTNYSRSEILTNFPVLIVLNTNLSGFNYSTFASSTGGDLRFKSGDGATELNYEIEQWNPAGNSYVWVQVPYFTNRCSALAQWGGFAGTAAPAYTTNGATWSNGYMGVWHLNELFGAHQDSSTNQGVARFTQAVGQGFPVGVASGCDDFNDLNGYSDYVSLPSMGTNGQVTVECWACLNTVPPDTLRGLVSCDPWTTGITHFRCNNSLQVQAANFNGTTLTSPANSISVSNWFYTGYVMAGAGSGTFRLFLNGTNVATGTGASPSDNSDMNIAREYGGRYLNARMDEVRISNVARSTNWLWATYQNIASNAVFNSASAVTSIGIVGTNITSTVIGNSLKLSWPADHTGWRLQVQTNLLTRGLGTNWVDVANSTATNQITLPIILTNNVVFYRMVFP